MNAASPLRDGFVTSGSPEHEAQAPLPPGPQQSATKSAPASTPAPDPADLDPEIYESTHVHNVYEAIAPHFSATRYKPWPVVADFLLAQPPGAVGLDVGCGNGKYLGVNPGVFIIGSDRSAALVALARKHGLEGRTAEREGCQVPSRGSGADRRGEQGASAATAGTEVLVADGLSLPFRGQSVDFVVCIAVIHHLSTRQRRQAAIRHLLDCARKPMPHEPENGGGNVLMYVWALEQGASRRGWEQGGDQDLLVPWVIKGHQQKRIRRKGRGGDGNSEGDALAGASEFNNDRTFQRFYHLYKEGELEEDVHSVGGRVVTSGYDRDNWWVIATNPPLTHGEIGSR